MVDDRMDPHHTWLLFDCRPMKAAAHHAIGECESGRIEWEETAARLGKLAASLPDLDPVNYRQAQSRLLIGCNFDRCRRLVDCLSDYTPRPWVTAAIFVGRWSVKFGALAAFVWFVVWLVR